MKTGTRPRLLVLRMAAMAGMLLILLVACGPTAQYHEEQAKTRQFQQEEATPVPCDRTAGTYPNLDETLSDLVGQYERCEKTETEAAALAPDHDGNTVLIEAVAGNKVDVIDKWMENQSIRPRFVETDLTDPHRVYAFVRVSLLGTLSQRKEVTAVNIPEDNGKRETTVAFRAPEDSAVLRHMRARGSRSLNSGPTGPELPWWLRGYNHPRSYPKMRGHLPLIAGHYERGEWDEHKDGNYYNCLPKRGDDSGDIPVSVYILDEGNDKAVVKRWLEAAGLDMDSYGNEIRAVDGILFAVVYLPIPKIIELSTVPEVHYLETGGCGEEDTSLFGAPVSPPNAGPGTAPRMGDIVTQGVALHGADDWHGIRNPPGGYKGQNVKIGIIDSDFGGINNLLDDELPPINRVHGYCWSFHQRQNLSTNLGICDPVIVRTHGTSVAEIVADIAPEAAMT